MGHNYIKVLSSSETYCPNDFDTESKSNYQPRLTADECENIYRKSNIAKDFMAEFPEGHSKRNNKKFTCSLPTNCDI